MLGKEKKNKEGLRNGLHGDLGREENSINNKQKPICVLLA